MKKYLKYIVIILLLISAFIAGWYLRTPENDKYLPAPQTSSINDYRFTENDVINAHNTKRIKAGIGTLAPNTKLSLAARVKAQDMIDRDYFSHNTPEGGEPWVFINSAGYNYLWAGENIAMEYSDLGLLMNSWMNSEEHKNNILSPSFTEIGVAIINGEYQDHQTDVIVVMFGTPR